MVSFSTRGLYIFISLVEVHITDLATVSFSGQSLQVSTGIAIRCTALGKAVQENSGYRYLLKHRADILRMFKFRLLLFALQ